MAVAPAGTDTTPTQDIAVSDPNVNLPTTDSSQLPVETEEDTNVILGRFRGLSRPRQIQLIAAISSTLAMLVVIFMWSSDPNYRLLFGKLSNESAGEIVQVLKQQNIDYKLDETTGELKIASNQLHEVRIMLAAQGLPKSDNAGFEVLDKQQWFGTSQFMEKARYHRALEGELGRSIAGLSAVEFARVHLAIPKQSVFVRDRTEPGASVMVKLAMGKSLDESQISAIVHLVASGIPDLEPDKVTVIDHSGKLLSKKALTGDMALSTAQFDYKKNLEEYYIARIERILTPIVGFEGVRSQVDAEIDFTSVERTQESFNPDLPALRSEHTISEESRGGDLGGIPGALTNQPPGVATVPEKLPGAATQNLSGPSRKSRQETFNYELDKTISHSKRSPGTLQRLSVAVVVDDRITFSDEGDVIRTALAPEEVARLESLIKGAVGFSVSRGDSLNVVNASFQYTQVMPPAPKLSLWQEQWVIDMAKQAAGILLILIFIVIVMRPVIRELTYKEPVEEEENQELLSSDEVEEAARASIAAEAESMGGLTSIEWEELGLSYDEYENMLRTLKEMAADDPRIVAQVVRTWVALDEDSGG